MGSHSLLQGIFPTQGSNPHLLHCRQILYGLSHQGSPWRGRDGNIKNVAHNLVLHESSHLPLQGCWPKYTLKGIQGEVQDEALCALGKLTELALRYIFSGEIFYEPGFWHLLMLRKALIQLTKMSVPHAATFDPDVCLTACASFTKITYFKSQNTRLLLQNSSLVLWALRETVFLVIILSLAWIKCSISFLDWLLVNLFLLTERSFPLEHLHIMSKWYRILHLERILEVFQLTPSFQLLWLSGREEHHLKRNANKPTHSRRK